MFENLGWWEIGVLALLALFILGPERLPKVIGDAARLLRTVRHLARNATGDLQRELGTDLDLTDLNPKAFVRKHLLSDEDQELLTKPFKDAMADLDSLSKADDPAPATPSVDLAKPAAAPRYDTDAT